MLEQRAKDHRGLGVLGLEDCLTLLRRATVGRLAFVHNGEPEVLPVTFGVDGTAPVFRTTWGSKLDVVARGCVVAFEADALDATEGVAWSVQVKGTADIVYDDAAIARCEALEVPIWVQEPSEQFWVRVVPTSVSGRVLHLA